MDNTAWTFYMSKKCCPFLIVYSLHKMDKTSWIYCLSKNSCLFHIAYSQYNKGQYCLDILYVQEVLSISHSILTALKWARLFRHTVCPRSLV